MNEVKGQHKVTEYSQDFSMRIKKIALEVLDSHKGVADCYKGMNIDEQLAFVEPFTADSNLLPPSDRQLRKLLERRLEISHHPVVAERHFSESYKESIQAYYSGHFIACTMMTHPINEGIIKFLVEKNSVQECSNQKRLKTIDLLKDIGLLTDYAAEASKEIYNSHRDDIHHMNKEISQIKDWHKQANQNLRNLTIVTSCVFGYDIDGVIFRPHFPINWDYYGKNHIGFRAIPSGMKGLLRIES